MTNLQPWLGTCHLTKGEGDALESYQATAAVWCVTRDAFDTLLRPHVEAQGFALLWSEDVLPAGQWMSRHPRERDTIALAPKVHEGHRVEMGTIGAVGKEDDPGQEPDSYLIIEEIEGVEPLDAQIGVHPKRFVPSALQAPLFGQSNPTEEEIAEYGGAENVPLMKTYAILDAAKMPYLLTGLLEASGLHYQSLFQGETQEELKEVAPYLVELEDGHSFVQKLFTGPDGINGLWDKELGIYIRSRAEFADIRKHFRKFTRVQDEQGKWYLLTWWKPVVFEALKSNSDLDHFFCFLTGKLTLYIVSPNTVHRSVRVKPMFAIAAKGRKREFPKHELLSVMRQIKIAERLRRIKFDLARILHQTTDQDRARLSDLVDKVYTDAANKYQIKKISHIKKLCIWFHFLGMEFEKKPDFEYVQRVLERSGSETRRMQNIEIWMRNWERNNAH